MATRKVTALRLQKRNRQRVNVYLDGEYAFGVARITAGWLQVGQEITPERISELQAKDSYETAIQRAMNFLSFRARSEQEVRRNLTKHGTGEKVIEKVIARLLEANLLDDQAFASLWVENRSEFRPRGRWALRMELRNKGISPESIEGAVENVDEDLLALTAARKAVRKYKHLEWKEFRQKLGGYLARRGFGYGTAAPAITQVWEELQAEGDAVVNFSKEEDNK